MILYFVSNEEESIVKIGITRDLEKRLKNLTSCSPVKLKILLSIHCFDWDSKLMPNEVEKYFHEEFKEYRSHGEWFYLTGKLSDFLKTNKGKRIKLKKEY